MKTEINTALASKINWTQIFLLVVNIAATAGFVGTDYLPHALAFVNIVGPIATIVFRTYFTEPSA